MGIIEGVQSSEEKPSGGLLDLLGPLGDLLVLDTVGHVLHGLLTIIRLDTLLEHLVNGLTNIPIEITLPINVNALGINTLEVTGTWGEVQQIP